MSALEATPEVQTVPFWNLHSDLKMVTSPVKLCCLLSPPPPHYDPDFRFQPRGCHEILKRGREVYIPPLPTLTTKSVLISLLISNVASQGAHIFYTVAMQTFHVQLGVSDILSC